MRPKKLPKRLCVGCQEVRLKKELARVVRTPEGEVTLDPTGKRSGRGAYVCRNPSCLEAALKGQRLARALKHDLTPDTVQKLREALGGGLSG